MQPMFSTKSDHTGLVYYITCYEILPSPLFPPVAGGRLKGGILQCPSLRSFDRLGTQDRLWKKGPRSSTGLTTGFAGGDFCCALYQHYRVGDLS